jgi:hypothetical protein
VEPPPPLLTDSAQAHTPVCLLVERLPAVDAGAGAPLVAVRSNTRTVAVMMVSDGLAMPGNVSPLADGSAGLPQGFPGGLFQSLHAFWARRARHGSAGSPWYPRAIRRSFVSKLHRQR